jgi:hypothetical protein
MGYLLFGAGVVATLCWWSTVRRARREEEERDRERAVALAEAKASEDPIERYSMEGRPDWFSAYARATDDEYESWVYLFPPAVGVQRLEYGSEVQRVHLLRRLDSKCWQRLTDKRTMERVQALFPAHSDATVPPRDLEERLRGLEVDRTATEESWEEVPDDHQPLVEACWQRWQASLGGSEPPRGE